MREVIHNVHRIKRPLPRTPSPFYRHLFLRGTGALTITRIHLDLPSGGGPNLPLLTSIEMTPDASAVVTFHRIHWKGSPEYAYLQIDGLHTAERTLHLGQILVRAYRLFGIEQLRLDVGAHDVKPVEFFLGSDLLKVTLNRE